MIEDENTKKLLPIFDGVYAFKTFSANIELSKLAKDFLTSDYNFKFHRCYIGKEYKAKEYLKEHPDFKFPYDYGNLSFYKVVETYPFGITHVEAFFTSTHVSVISKENLAKKANFISFEDLIKNYESTSIIC